MGARGSDSGFPTDRIPAVHDAGGADGSLADQLRPILLQSDPEKLAKRLGLRSAAAAKKLLAQDAASTRLAERMAEGCAGLSADDAVKLCRDLIGQRT